MKRLLYVPIIHTLSDMGSLGPAIDEVSASVLGENRWAKHKETVARFWDAIGSYLASVDASHLKLYQDGLAADGNLGRRVVEEAARRGSKNHQIVLNLMDRGAEIRQTEDLLLLLEEGRQLLRATQGGSNANDAQDFLTYDYEKQRLTEQRDRFVAGRINETLKEGETGVLFMGAYHNVIPLLAEDILVTEVKPRNKVEAYFQELLNGLDEGELEQLASSLTCPA